MSTYLRASRTLHNGVTRKVRFQDETVHERMTVEILCSENRTQRRLWTQALERNGLKAESTVKACWERACVALGLRVSRVPNGECGLLVAFSVNGPRLCLQLLTEFPIARVEYLEAGIPFHASGQGEEKPKPAKAKYRPGKSSPEAPIPQEDSARTERELAQGGFLGNGSEEYVI